MLADLPYAPEAMPQFHGYVVEWVDERSFGQRPPEAWAAYTAQAAQRFTVMGWQGDGEIELLWIPPFLLDAALAKGLADYEKAYGLRIFNDPPDYGLHPHSPTRGLLLWHVKQQSDGLSFVLSPLALNVGDFF